jgi:general stress protein 26
MDRDEAVKEALVLAEQSTIAMVGTNGGDGYPHIKAMIKMENEGLAAAVAVWV